METPPIGGHGPHLMNAPGDSEATAPAQLAEMSVLPGHLKAPQVSRHADLDARPCQAGSSGHKVGRMSDTANAER